MCKENLESSEVEDQTLSPEEKEEIAKVLYDMKEKTKEKDEGN